MDSRIRVSSVAPTASLQSSTVKASQSGSKWVKVISTIIFLQLQDPKPDRSGPIRLNPTAAEGEAMGNVIAVSMAGPKRPMRGTRDHSISPPPKARQNV